MSKAHPKEYYYYYRTKDARHPRITVCLLSNGIDYSRGVSLCSTKDNIDKKRGRAIARGRALRAWHTKKEELPIVRSAGRLIVDDTICPFSFKASYNQSLTEHEKKMLGV